MQLVFERWAAFEPDDAFEQERGSLQDLSHDLQQQLDTLETDRDRDPISDSVLTDLYTMLGSASGLVFSIKMTSIANTFVILSGTPALAAVFSWIFLREATSRSTWVAIVAVMVGITIVVSGSFGSGNLVGDALAVFSVVCLSLLFTLLRKYQDVSRLASVGLGALFLAIVMFFFAAPSTYSINTWLIMGMMGLFTAPFGRVLSMVATRYITAPEVSMTLMLETVLASIWAFIFFSEIPPTESIVGGGVILVTIFLYTLSTMKDE